MLRISGEGVKLVEQIWMLYCSHSLNQQLAAPKKLVMIMLVYYFHEGSNSEWSYHPHLVQVLLNIAPTEVLGKRFS